MLRFQFFTFFGLQNVYELSTQNLIESSLPSFILFLVRFKEILRSLHVLFRFQLKYFIKISSLQTVVELQRKQTKFFFYKVLHI